MGDYKRQHTVTEAYLRRFTAPESAGSLRRYDKESGRCQICNVKRATVHFYQYSIENPDGTFDHTVEHALSRIENGAIPLLDKLQHGSALSIEETRILATFLATMFRRSRRMVQESHEAARRIESNPTKRRQIINGILSDLRGTYSDEELDQVAEDYVEGKIAQFTDGELKRFQFEAWGKNVALSASIFETFHWQVIKSADREQIFVTSDAPAAICSKGDPERKRAEFIPPASPEAELSFPLSPRFMLIGNRTEIFFSARATKSRVRELNSRTIRMADRYVFTGVSSAQLGRLFEDSRHGKPPKLPTPDLTFQ